MHNPIPDGANNVSRPAVSNLCWHKPCVKIYLVVVTRYTVAMRTASKVFQYSAARLLGPRLNRSASGNGWSLVSVSCFTHSLFLWEMSTIPKFNKLWEIATYVWLPTAFTNHLLQKQYRFPRLQWHWLEWHPGYSDSFDRSQMTSHIPKMMWLEWHLLRVTLFSCPEGVTVSGEDCTR